MSHNLLILTAALTLLVGCGTRTSMLRPTSRTPASVGIVKFSKDTHGNTVAELNLQHLPLPADLSPELSTYVVWANPANSNLFLNLAQVGIDASRAATVQVRTSHPAFSLMVTAEPVGTASAPSDFRVLEGRVGMEEGN